MQLRIRALVVQVCFVALIVTLVVFDAVVHADRAAAQMRPGEYALYQPGSSDPVGWVRVSGDHSAEWWAYVEGAYVWADSTNIPISPWHLESRYMGVGSWATYATWKSDVLQRSAAGGHTITFQNHAVTEESVNN